MHWEKVTCLSSQRCLSKCNVCGFSNTPGHHRGVLPSAPTRDPSVDSTFQEHPQKSWGGPTGLSPRTGAELAQFRGNRQTCLPHCHSPRGPALPPAL